MNQVYVSSIAHYPETNMEKGNDKASRSVHMLAFHRAIVWYRILFEFHSIFHLTRRFVRTCCCVYRYKVEIGIRGRHTTGTVAFTPFLPFLRLLSRFSSYPEAIRRLSSVDYLRRFARTIRELISMNFSLKT